MTDLWQQRRSSLNHDWLKNDFVRSVSACIDRLDKPHPDLKRLGEFLSKDLPVWERNRAVLRTLLAEAEDELSPRQLFDVPPLSLCDAKTREWLPMLVHALWLTRYPVRQRVKDALKAIDTAEDAYGRIAPLADVFAKTADISQLKDNISDLRDFAGALRMLTCAISGLPHRILVA